MSVRGCLGGAYVQIHDGWTEITLPDGTLYVPWHVVVRDQETLAKELLYSSAKDMNRDHDLTHCLLAEWLGLSCSPALSAAASGAPSEYAHGIEEQAVLAIQRYANAMGINLFGLVKEKLTMGDKSWNG